MILTTTTRTKLEHSAKMLAAEFDGVPQAVIAHQVAATAALLLENASFDDYIPILTHRFVRQRLRNGASTPALGEAA
jgi:hypothetical protein